mgnify:CR=1 FL=1
MIKIIGRSYVEVHCKKYPETASALKAWLYLIQSPANKTLKDLLKCFPKASVVDDKHLTFKINPSLLVLAIFHSTLPILRIQVIGNFNEYNKI